MRNARLASRALETTGPGRRWRYRVWQNHDDIEDAAAAKDEGQTLEELGEEPDLWVPRPDGGFDPRFLMGVIVLAACSLHNFRMLGLRYTRS